MSNNLSRQTISVTTATKSHHNNFDLMRMLLAITVYLGHYSWIFPNGPVLGSLFMPILGEDGQRLVQAFFIISGFLMFQSLNRSSDILSYFEKRFRRIFPGYFVVIMSSAIIGFFLTDLTTKEYLSLDLMKYIGFNLLFMNFIHPFLPGVFDNQEIHQVNAPLWTLKIEVMYYIFVPLIVMIRPKILFLLTCIIIYFISILYYSYLNQIYVETGKHSYHVMATQLPGQLCYFISGTLITAYKDYMSKHLQIIIPCTTLLFIASLYLQIFSIYPLCLAILVLYFCIFAPYLGNWGKYGDLSYGIYILHFPVMQIERSLGILKQHQFLLFPLTTAIVFGLAYLMWHFIESPALKGRWIKKDLQLIRIPS